MHRFACGLVSAHNLLRFTQVATRRVVPFTGLLSLLNFDVVSEGEPFQTTARTAQLNVGQVAVGLGYGVVSDEVAELGAESGRTA